MQTKQNNSKKNPQISSEIGSKLLVYLRSNQPIHNFVRHI